MVRSRTSSAVLQVAFLLAFTFVCGCGGVNNGTGGGNGNGGPSQAVIAFAANSGVIVQGQSTTLSWKVTNATSFSISPAVASGTLPLTGSATVSPAQTTTYVGTATDANGKTATSSVVVTVVPQGSAPSMTLTLSPNVVAAGQTTTLTWASTNSTSVAITPSILGDDVTSVALSGSAAVVVPATTTFTATATGAQGVTASASATVNILGVTLTASPTKIGPGQTATLSWTSSNAATLSIDQGVPPISGANGSVTVSPTANTTFTITAVDGQGNSATSSATVNVVTNTGLQGIKHIIVMLQENRSFDSYFSKLGDYATNVDHIPGYQINAGYDPNVILPLFGGGTGHLFHEPTERTDNLSPAWNESHFDIDQQTDGTFKMDRFALTSHSVSAPTDPKGLRALGQYDQTDIPYYYELATQFATSDSFHSSLLANTVPNRQYID